MGDGICDPKMGSESITDTTQDLVIIFKANHYCKHYFSSVFNEEKYYDYNSNYKFLLKVLLP